MAENPRYPHWCRITRKTTESPLVDEGGFTDVDEEYDPLGSDVSAVTAVNGQENATESSSSEEDPSEGVETQVIYEGECRSYEKNTTSDRGDVITSYRGLALPMKQDDWNRIGLIPQEGDEVAVKRGTHTEYGRVIDKNPGTADFAGTHIIWRYGRN